MDSYCTSLCKPHAWPRRPRFIVSHSAARGRPPHLHLLLLLPSPSLSPKQVLMALPSLPLPRWYNRQVLIFLCWLAMSAA